MRFSVLSSGSKANSTYLETGCSRILIDCGLSARETERRLTRIGVDPASLDAIIITHEHSDHIMGVRVLSRRHKIPVYANRATSKFIDKAYAIDRFSTGERFWIKNLDIHPFSVVHDASDPVGFAVHAEGLKFVLATDLGRVTPLVREMVKGAHAMVLESNHDQEMLRDCAYPWQLKQRISSSHGHLSNDCAGALLKESWHSDLLHVTLAHLSENSNTPDLALKTVGRYLERRPVFHLIAAAVTHETPLFTVGESEIRVSA
ncbi:MAG: MBL fold metallo-hydrolase [Deltaproteobacteria bacterium]|nr:MBL fold metallo-hydrolase [Deltaproteobacteria bacterium]